VIRKADESSRYVILFDLISYLVELSQQISLHIHALYRSNIEVTEICQYVRSAAKQVFKH